MSVPYTEKPWAFLNDYRGKAFSGEWPTLPEMFKITVSRYPQRPCFTIYEPDRISLNYTEALQRIQALARWLYRKGIRKGDRLAVTGKNSPEWTIAYLGILFAGAVVVPIDYHLKTEETDLLIKTAGAKILFVDEEKHEHYTQSPGGLIEVISLKKDTGTYIYDLDGPEADIEQAAETDIAAILFTSGTMGNPKGVMLTHRNFVSDCYLAQGTPLLVLHTDVFYAILPLHHSYCMLAVFIETISTGAEMVFGKRMVTSQMLKELREGKVTMLLGVPLLFNKFLTGLLRGIKEKGPIAYGLISFLMGISGLIKKVFKVNPGKKIFGFILEKASLTSMRICICGGGPLAPSVFKKYNQLGIDFVQGYGLTETSPIIAINPVEHYKETSVGRPCAHVDMKILNPDERGIGEVIVKGSMVMKGYYNMPAETAETFTADGYLKTGDLGYMDSENYLYLTGRAKNMIVTEGGKNVYPEEIENEFQLFEEIEQILVRAFVHDKRTKAEVIEALVFPNPEFRDENGEALSPAHMKDRIDRIMAEVNQRLLPYQRIERTTILDKPMEMTTTKKIKRGLL
ncbi:MAG: AMP-binding protein [Treponema sp.]|jgi:long-chain acyl-CoA synthetase|nr:AMP-binding protein [Treponema sp.]